MVASVIKNESHADRWCNEETMGYQLDSWNQAGTMGASAEGWLNDRAFLNPGGHLRRERYISAGGDAPIGQQRPFSLTYRKYIASASLLLI